MVVSGNVPTWPGRNYRGRFHDQDCGDRRREDKASNMGHCGPGEVGVDDDDGQWSYHLMVMVISYAEMQKVADMADISVLFFPRRC